MLAGSVCTPYACPWALSKSNTVRTPQCKHCLGKNAKLCPKSLFIDAYNKGALFLEGFALTGGAGPGPN